MRVVSIGPLGREPGASFSLHPHLTVVRGLDGAERAWLIDALGRIDGATAATATGEMEALGVRMPLDGGSLGLIGVSAAADGIIGVERLFPALFQGRESLGGGNDAGVDATVTASPEAVDATDPVDSWFSTDTDQVDDDLDSSLPALPSDTSAPPVGAPEAVIEATTETALARRIESLQERRHELSRLASAVSDIDTTEIAAALEVLDNAPSGVPVAEAGRLADAWRDLQKELNGLDVGSGPEERAALAAVAEARQAVAAAEEALLRPQLTEDQMARIEAAHAATGEASDKVDRRFGGGRARKQLAEAEAEEARLLGRFGFESWVDYMLTASRRTDDPEMETEQATLEAARVELEICIGELDAIPGAVGRRHRRARLNDRQEELSDQVARVLGRQPVGDDVEADLRGVTAPYDASDEVSALAAALERTGTDVETVRHHREKLSDLARRVVSAQANSDRRRVELQRAVSALDEALVVLKDAAAEGQTEVPAMPPLPDMAEPPVELDDLANDVVANVAPRTPALPRIHAEADDLAGEDSGTDHRDPATVEPTEATETTETTETTAAVDSTGSASPEEDAIARLFDPEASQSPSAADPSGDPSNGSRATGDKTDEGNDDGGGDSVMTDPARSGPAASVEDMSPEARAALVDDVHWEAMMAIAGARHEGPAGQAPVVFDDPFGSLTAEECVEVMSRLVRLTDQVQMIVITDRVEVVEWAAAIGGDHASVLELVG